MQHSFTLALTRGLGVGGYYAAFTVSGENRCAWSWHERFFFLWICDLVKWEKLASVISSTRVMSCPPRCVFKKAAACPRSIFQTVGTSGRPWGFFKIMCQTMKRFLTNVSLSRISFLGNRFALQLHRFISSPVSPLHSAKCVSSTLHPPFLWEQFSWSCAGGFVV